MYGYICYICVGDITPEGYAHKKESLEKELAGTPMQQAETPSVSGKRECKQLEHAGTSMNATINKLFNLGQTQPAPKPTLPKKARAAKQGVNFAVCHRSVKVEVVCMPCDTATVPQGAVRAAFRKSGYISTLSFKKADNELIVRDKIHQLFPKVFTSSDSIEKFHFLKVEANKLKKITLPYEGFTSWNGAAIYTVAGQGALYVLPVRFVTKVCTYCIASTRVSYRWEVGAHWNPPPPPPPPRIKKK